MKKTEIDYWITAMLESNPNVSDLNITVGKTLQVESSGELKTVDVEPPVKSLSVRSKNGDICPEPDRQQQATAHRPGDERFMRPVLCAWK